MFPGGKIPGEDIIFSFYPIVFALVLGSILGFRNYMKGPQCRSPQSMEKKTVIVTGANTGCGLEIARDMANRGARVICACRDEAKGKAAVKNIKETTQSKTVVFRKLDLASLKSIREFVQVFLEKESRLDVLINNAGLMSHPEAKSEDGFELHLAVNYLGTFLLTHLLLDKMKSSAPSRIINVACYAYRIGELDVEDLQFEKREYKPGAAFTQSKLAVMMFTRTLAKYLEGSNVTVNAVHPGVVDSECHRHMPYKKSKLVSWSFVPFVWMLMKGPKDGAQTAIQCAVAKEEEGVSGKFYCDCQQLEMEDVAKDDEVCQQLWDLSLKLTKVTLPDQQPTEVEAE